jgi:hypothetical protein
VAAPAVVRAQTVFNWKMTSFYGPNAAFYSTGPGGAKDLIKRIDDMSGGRIKIQFYGAGELIPAAEGFDAVSSGTVEMNYANAYFWTGKLFAGRPAPGSQVLLHHRLARERHGQRAHHQRGQVELAAAGPQGGHRERLRGLQRDQRGPVPEEQRRGHG